MKQTPTQKLEQASHESSPDRKSELITSVFKNNTIDELINAGVPESLISWAVTQSGVLEGLFFQESETLSLSPATNFDDHLQPR